MREVQQRRSTRRRAASVALAGASDLRHACWAGPGEIEPLVCASPREEGAGDQALVDGVDCEG